MSGGTLRQRKKPLKKPQPAKRTRSFINVAPLNTPLSHRLETIGVIWHCISIPFFICLFLFTISLGWLIWITLILPYFIWWYGFDLHTPTNGKVSYRVRNSMKNLIIWKWFVDYFPIQVHKSCELEPTFTKVMVEENTSSDDEQDLISENSRTLIDYLFKKVGLKKRLNDSDTSKTEKFKNVSVGPRYIFGYHPHGVISMGVVGLFGTNALRNEPYEPPMKWLKPFFHDPSKGKRLFAGIGNIFPLTLTTQFTVPFYRDYLMGLGITSASGKNIKSLINNGDNSVCLVVGGAQESLLNDMIAKHARIGYGYKEGQDMESDSEEDGGREVKLVLNKRKGFVKLAIELGNVSLVPTFAFGEADVYRLSRPKPGSLGYKFQQWMKKTFSFTIPFFSARGVFIYDFGFLPFRNPINICVGNPVHIPEGVLKDYKTEDETVESNKRDPFFKKKMTTKTKIPSELLDKYHKLYVDELKRVYEENKDRFGYGDVELNIIE